MGFLQGSVAEENLARGTKKKTDFLGCLRTDQGLPAYVEI